MSKKKILVTWGAGFIGSHLCETLVKNRNLEIYSLDNYFTGSVKNHVKGVKYYEGNTSDIKKHIKHDIDLIYHLGEYSRVEQSFSDIEKVWEFNKEGIFSVLEFCREKKAKIVYAGSSTKFGDGGLGSSQSPYAWSKATNTELVVNYGRWFKIDYAITYFYNVYGPMEIATGKYATLIALFLQKKKLNLPLTVVSPGTQRRNFTHVDDIINGLVLVGEKGYGDDFGIGNKKSYSILEIAKMFNSPIEIIPARNGNRMVSEVVTKKTEDLGWLPFKSIEDYIESNKE